MGKHRGALAAGAGRGRIIAEPRSTVAAGSMRAACVRERLRVEARMTDREAVALAVFGYPRRPLLGALIRAWLERTIPEGDALPARGAHESVIEWACRAAGLAQPREEAETLLARADRQLAAGRRTGQTALGLGAPGYPALLRQIPDPPPAVWVRGSWAALSAPRMVALVGARAATRAGLAVAAELASGLASAGVTVVSGLARGVDSAAHRAAVDAGGVSVAVLGSGLDRIYPAEHAGLAEALTVRGAVVTEHPPGTPALAYHFPLRNRIISGLSAAVVVVEASDKSGSLITAMAALEQGRDVMAVPGPVGAGRHRGAHALLRDGARLVEGPADVLAELGWAASGPAPRDISCGLAGELAAELGLEPAVEDFSPDEVAAATGWPIGAVSARLAALEIEGRIQRIGGGRFMGCQNRVLT